MVLTKEEVLSILEKVVSKSTADQCEACFSGRSWSISRFANSYIHQNVAEDNRELALRVVSKKKVGKAKTNQLTSEAIADVVRRAEKIAGVQKEIEDFVSLPSPTSIPSVKGFFKKTVEVSPEERASVIKASVDHSEDRGIDTVSGYYYTGVEELAVTNSLGIEAYFRGTISSFKINATVEGATGVAENSSRNCQNLKPEALTDRACEKALAARDPEKIPNGVYPVILEELAACEIAGYVAAYACGAQAYQEGRSAFSGRIGEKFMDEKVSIWDDGADERGFPLPFDIEGVGKQKVDLVTEGMAKGVVYDSFHAHREGKRSTGHALEPNVMGPIPTNVFMEKGTKALDDLVSECEKGILVTRFHYTNVMDRLKILFTGMTRDGTFLVEQGEVQKALKNLRFVQSALEALSEVEAVSNEWGNIRVELINMSVLAPALHLKRFSFTGATM